MTGVTPELLLLLVGAIGSVVGLIWIFRIDREAPEGDNWRYRGRR